MVNFTLNDIHRMADTRSFTRGQDYFERGFVVRACYDKGVDAYIGEVRGTGRNVYRVMLDITDGELVGDCTCPVGFDCKHAVATGLQLLHEARQVGMDRAAREVVRPAPTTGRRNTSPPAWASWLAELPPAPRGAPEALEPGRHYLLYHLEQSTLGLGVATRKAYLKKDGRWSQFKHYSLDVGSLAWSRPAFLEKEDVAILQLLSRPHAFGRLELSGELGHQALKHLLRCGRFYFDERPLKAGDTRNLQWQWRHNESGSGGTRQLVAVLEGMPDSLQASLEGSDAWRLIPVDPPRYLETGTATIGAITTALSTAQLQHLLAMPPVSDDELAQLGPPLRRLIPKEHLPLPVEPSITTVREFRPHITLVGCDFGQYRLPAMTLHFDYAGFSLAAPYSPQYAGAEQTCERDGHYYQITRDIDAERICCDTINALGLYLDMAVPGGQEEVWLPEVPTPEQAMQRWRELLDRDLPALERQGWVIGTDPSYRFEVKRADFTFTLTDGDKHWFEFGLDLILEDGTRLQTVELVEYWLQSGAPDELVLGLEGQWICVNAEPLQGIRGLLLDLLNQKQLDRTVRLPAFQAAQLQDLPDLDQRRAPATRRLMASLRDFSGLDNVPPPGGLTAELRGYQQAGLDWLAFLQRYGFGGILADDMGLGKTLQTLALVQHLKDSGHQGRPALVIAPTSLTGNWLHEAARFTPGLQVTLVHGPKRERAFRQIAKSDLVITTYPLLLRDRARYDRRKFSLLVLDEAQAIKNPATKIATCVRDIRAETRLCLSGTPLENHLGELWALMDFALPGLLGGRKNFNQFYRKPIEQAGDETRQQELARKVRPFLLRRTKGEVAAELPPKTESIQYVELSGKQRALYESVRISMEKRIRDLVARQGMAKSHIQFLDALLKLRQACIDPRLVKLDQAAKIKESAKLDWLATTLPQLLEEGRRVLVFSQFTQVLKLIEEQLSSQGVDYSKLTGQTRKRQAAIDRFQGGEVRVFLISLKAGGSGLNLTAADVVIHMDPWWNPAVENQATDRAHRIGQDKPVFVYKLVAADTVEERIQLMQQQKQALADALFDATNASALPQDQGALLALLS